MGCSASFPEDQDKFLGGTGFPAAKKYLDETLVNKTGPMSLCLRKNLTKEPIEYTVKKSDGSAFCIVENSALTLRVKNPKGDLIALMIHDVRLSEVNGIDATFNLPHMYVYALLPYADGPKESDFTDGDTPVYFWSRIHKTSMGSKCKSYEVALAGGKRTGENLNIEMFRGSAFDFKDFGEGNIAVKWNGKGAARVTNAAFDFDCTNCYGIAVAPNVDPILVMCCLFAMESLWNR
mmetsp:Transcript_110715/g.313222  ORF Transcript_110715/g.313222 Transcript_110715/m.313222 type:complete len:235 (+) Transcript_110715:63-767(+)